MGAARGQPLLLPKRARGWPGPQEDVGTGEEAELIADADAALRLAREQRAAREGAELERLEALCAPLEELSEAAGVLARAQLVASGYRRRKGEYRRARA